MGCLYFWYPWKEETHRANIKALSLWYRKSREELQHRLESHVTTNSSERQRKTVGLRFFITKTILTFCQFRWKSYRWCHLSGFSLQNIDLVSAICHTEVIFCDTAVGSSSRQWYLIYKEWTSQNLFIWTFWGWSSFQIVTVVKPADLIWSGICFECTIQCDIVSLKVFMLLRFSWKIWLICKNKNKYSNHRFCNKSTELYTQ